MDLEWWGWTEAFGNADISTSIGGFDSSRAYLISTQLARVRDGANADCYISHIKSFTSWPDAIGEVWIPESQAHPIELISNPIVVTVTLSTQGGDARMTFTSVAV